MPPFTRARTSNRCAVRRVGSVTIVHRSVSELLLIAAVGVHDPEVTDLLLLADKKYRASRRDYRIPFVFGILREAEHSWCVDQTGDRSP